MSFKYIFNADDKDNVIVRHLGICDYFSTYTQMREFTHLRANKNQADIAAYNDNDELWCVEHPAVYTLGQAGLPEHLLRNPLNIPCIQTDRGGQITYHGLGQIVIYVLMNLRKHNIYVRELVYKLEQSIIDTLKIYNIDGLRKEGAPGIYVAQKQTHTHRLNALNVNNNEINFLSKIAAIGLKVSRGYTYHGIALNVNMNLTPFSYINPCGYAGLNTIDMRGVLNFDVNSEEIINHLLNCIRQ